MYSLITAFLTICKTVFNSNNNLPLERSPYSPPLGHFLITVTIIITNAGIATIMMHATAIPTTASVDSGAEAA